jgi:hypothetical protein
MATGHIPYHTTIETDYRLPFTPENAVWDFRESYLLKGGDS